MIEKGKGRAARGNPKTTIGGDCCIAVVDDYADDDNVCDIELNGWLHHSSFSHPN